MQFELPRRLVELIAQGRWVHPGDERIRAVVPFIREPLQLVGSSKSILGSHEWCLMGPDEAEDELFSEYRGSRAAARDLPWIDVEKTLFLMINGVPGDDVGVALDYRTDPPRVIASDWSSGRCRYRLVSDDPDAFLASVFAAP